MVRYWRRLSTSCMIVLAAAGAGAAAEYETPKNRLAKDVLPAAVAAGADYTVGDPVVSDGYMYQFKVKSPYVVFDVTGTGALRKLEREIWAIGQLKQVTKSEAFLKSLKDQAGKPLVFAKDVVTKPGATLSGIPKGVGRLFSNASTAITNTKDPSQESAARELSRTSPRHASASSTRRSWGRWGSRPISPSATSTTRSLPPARTCSWWTRCTALGRPRGGMRT